MCFFMTLYRHLFHGPSQVMPPNIYLLIKNQGSMGALRVPAGVNAVTPTMYENSMNNNSVFWLLHTQRKKGTKTVPLGYYWYK